MKRLGLAVAAMAVLGGAFLIMLKAGRLVATHNANSARNHIYTTLKKKNAYRFPTGNLTVLTTDGNALLKPDLSFKKVKDKKHPAVAYRIFPAVTNPIMYTGTTKIPDNLRSGDLLRIKLPFPARMLGGSTHIDVQTKQGIVRYTGANMGIVGDSRSSKEIALMVDYAYKQNKKKTKLHDFAMLQPQAGETVPVSITTERAQPTPGVSTQTLRDEAAGSLHWESPSYRAGERIYQFKLYAYQSAPVLADFKLTQAGQDITSKVRYSLAPETTNLTGMQHYTVTLTAVAPITGAPVVGQFQLHGRLALSRYWPGDSFSQYGY
ncbi:hypothetical protein L248_0696 [Schleiferilactobacillus shenzhenensis LY-73]|uniref:Uncharacterized protein n=2 Tax=Schleiferilactobacillus shenzhenensis TaxID=1231337 RepID=U4TKA8_9LACO|nr:hypothetical protein L248_0696 [Schleiferilactobacillus shenzhenensis LY-73]